MALGGSRGQAIVLDQPRDPLAIYTAGERAKEQASFRQQQLGLNQRRRDDANLKNILSHKFQGPEERFLTWGDGVKNKVNQDVFNLLQNNPHLDSTDLLPQITQFQGAAQKDLSKAKEVETLFKQKNQSIGSLKNVDQSKATEILNQTIAKDSPYDVDTELLQNVEQIPAIYDLNGMVADSVAGVKDQFRTTDIGDIQNSPLGQFVEVTDQKIRFKDIDKTMDYILRGNDVTDAGIAQKLNGGAISDRIRYNIAQKEVAAGGGNPNDVSQVMSRFKEIQYDSKYAPQVRQQLRNVLDQLNQEERDVNIVSMGRFKQASQKEQDYANSKIRREEALDAIVVPFGRNGELKEPSTKAQESLGKLRNADFGGGKIVDAKFERGGYTISPEWMSKLKGSLDTPQNQEVLKEAVKHLVPIKGNGNKVMFTVKTGTMFGAPETQVNVPLDLSNPNAKVLLNAMMNQNAGERKIIYDDLYQKNQSSPRYLDDDDDEEYLDD